MTDRPFPAPRGSALGDQTGEAAAQAAASPTPKPVTARASVVRSQTAAWMFLLPVLIYLVTFYVWPLLRNLDLSFRDYTLRSFIDGTQPEGLGADEMGNVFGGLTGACEVSKSGGCLQKFVKK